MAGWPAASGPCATVPDQSGLTQWVRWKSAGRRIATGRCCPRCRGRPGRLPCSTAAPDSRGTEIASPRYRRTLPALRGRRRRSDGSRSNRSLNTAPRRPGHRPGIALGGPRRRHAPGGSRSSLDSPSQKGRGPDECTTRGGPRSSPATPREARRSHVWCDSSGAGLRSPSIERTCQRAHGERRRWAPSRPSCRRSCTPAHRRCRSCHKTNCSGYRWRPSRDSSQSAHNHRLAGWYTGIQGGPPAASR